MTQRIIDTPRLRLVLDSTELALSRIAAMSPEDQAQVSPEWIARLQAASPTPWTHSFSVRERASDIVVGMCAFKGGVDADGAVEIAYGVDEKYRGRGYAKEAARALTEFAFTAGAKTVRAHTLREQSPSTGVLSACGFQFVGEVVDPEDGPVWRWEQVAAPLDT